MQSSIHPRADSYLVVLALEINFGEDLQTQKMILHIIQMRNWKAILDRNLVNHAAIYTHPS